ncbi:uncharacterized protein LOC132316332 [Cornus florida]|uniref:uncharacterized protein LOC132316332 n=1 Tax=Cornus florida TaxID=4283 RepID=UPI0028A1616A|nr:uncharacterized protein LOC132316332 [Cornus florida]
MGFVGPVLLVVVSVLSPFLVDGLNGGEARNHSIDVVDAQGRNTTTLPNVVVVDSKIDMNNGGRGGGSGGGGGGGSGGGSGGAVEEEGVGVVVVEAEDGVGEEVAATEEVVAMGVVVGVGDVDHQRSQMEEEVIFLQ